MAQQASPYVAYASTDSGFSCFWSYRGQRLYASTVLSGSAANRGNGTERVKIIFISW